MAINIEQLQSQLAYSKARLAAARQKYDERQLYLTNKNEYTPSRVYTIQPFNTAKRTADYRRFDLRPYKKTEHKKHEIRTRKISNFNSQPDIVRKRHFSSLKAREPAEVKKENSILDIELSTPKDESFNMDISEVLSSSTPDTSVCKRRSNSYNIKQQHINK